MENHGKETEEKSNGEVKNNPVVKKKLVSDSFPASKSVKVGTVLPIQE